jgi:hypothetical protein
MKIAELLESKKIKQRLDPKCWTGWHKDGTKIKGGVRVNNCVKNEDVEENLADGQDLDEKWSQKYKQSINCNHPRGFSQKAHCAARRKRQHHEPTKSKSVSENFADGRGPGRPGDSARHGIPKHATLAQLDDIGNGSGRAAQLARWQANMRRGRNKRK